MAFDGITTRAIAKELEENLLLGKIEKIYQPERDELIFLIHTKQGKKKVYMSVATSHTGVYLTEGDYQNPTNPSSFCMFMRKHLSSARIVRIEQYNFERIIEMDFETRDELGFNKNKRLIIEIMGKHSNIILVDLANQKILECIKRVSIDVNRARQLLPGLTYEYPPTQDKIPFLSATSEDLISIKSSHDVLEKIMGISPLISREIFDAKDSAKKLNEFQLALTTMDLCPKVYLKEDGTPLDFHVLPIKEFENTKSISFNSVSETVSYYYSHKFSSNRIKQKSSDLTRHVNALLKKTKLKKQRLLEDLMKAENSDRYKLYGEILTANLHLVKAGDSKVTLTNYYDGEPITIPLDKRYHPSKNAQNYFKKYSKAKTAVIEKKVQLEETENDIIYLDSVNNFIDSAETTIDIDAIREELIDNGYLRRRRVIKGKKIKHKMSPIEYKTSDGFKILVGRNNKENDHLTMKMASKNDIWFHTKDIPGSHTILFIDGKKPSDIAIFEAAAIAAFHSKGKLSENVPVDYTKVRFVKKPSGAKPGMVIFTNNKTVYVTPFDPSSNE